MRSCALLISLLLLATVLAGCESAGGGASQPAASDAPAAEPAAPRRASEQPAGTGKAKRRRVGTAAYMLKRIKRLPASSSATYRRDYFGSWASRQGCNTRQWVLIEESRRGSEAGCLVRRGYWLSAYDGIRTRQASSFDIDHLVPLGEAWVSGASRWSAGTRKRYANDLGYSGTLRAVSASSNRSKGDADPTGWLPPRKIHRCKYIGTWVAVKYRWKLTIDPAERAVLARYVMRCGRKSDVPIPRRARVRIAKRPIGRGRSGNKRRPGGKRKTDSDRRYPTCAAAKAHGLGPYYKGQDREFGWYTDRDRDGVVCE